MEKRNYSHYLAIQFAHGSIQDDPTITTKVFEGYSYTNCLKQWAWFVAHHRSARHKFIKANAGSGLDEKFFSDQKKMYEVLLVSDFSKEMPF